MVLLLRHRQGLRKASGLAAATHIDCYPGLNQADFLSSLMDSGPVAGNYGRPRSLLLLRAAPAGHCQALVRAGTFRIDGGSANRVGSWV